jgi:hypothetical protein
VVAFKSMFSRDMICSACWISSPSLVGGMDRMFTSSEPHVKLDVLRVIS